MISVKNTKKVASIILSFLTLVSAFTSLIISTNAVDFPADSVYLYIHKYAMPDTTTNREDYIKNTKEYHTDDSLISDISDPSNANPPTIPTGAVPVEGVKFAIYKVGGPDTPVPDTSVPDTPYPNYDDKNGSLAWYNEGNRADNDNPVITNADGLATFYAQQFYGLYYVKEIERPANIAQTSVPFFVYLPLTNADGSGWLRNVHVYPKNIYLESAAVFKKTYDNKTIEEMQAAGNAISFKSDNPTKIGLFAKGADNRLLATIELTSDNSEHTATPTGTADSKITFTDTAKSTEAFKPIEIKEYKGIILVNHLIHKDNDYYFQEVQGGALGKDGQYTIYSINSAKQNVTVKAPPTTVSFGSNHEVVKRFVAGVDAGDPNDAVTECTLNNSTVPNNIEKYVVKTSASDKSSPDTTIKKLNLPLKTNNATSENSAIINSSDNFSFMIKADIAKDIESYDRFNIEDTINSDYFTIKPGNIKVTVCGSNGSKIGNDLVKDTNYEFDDNESNKLTFSFIIDPTKKESYSALKRPNAHHILIEIPFTINSNNIKENANHALENRAILTYSFTTPEDDAEGHKIDKNYDVESDPLYVGYLGAWFRKVGAEDTATGLSGAEFEISKGSTKLAIKQNPTGGYEVVTSDAWGASETLTSASGNGDIYIYGLDLDEYTLTETKAPEGYQLLANEDKYDINIDKKKRNSNIYFTVSNTTALTEAPSAANKRQIVNFKKTDLPATGGIGTIIFTVAGITAIVGPIAIFLVHKKKRKANI